MTWSTLIDANENIHVRFDGYLDATGGVRSANEVLRLLDGRVRDLVLEVVNMTGYHRSARLAWQALLWAQRGLIRHIVMIGAGPMVRIGGSVIARHLGVPLSIVAAARVVEEDAPRSRTCSSSSSLGWEVTRPISAPISMPMSRPLSGVSSGASEPTLEAATEPAAAVCSATGDRTH